MVMGFTIEIRNKDRVIKTVNELPEEVRELVRKGLNEGGEAVQKTAKDIVPVMEGEVRDSIETIIYEWNEVHVETDVPHSFFLEHGTPPHVIEARNAENLVFFWDEIGEWVIKPKVHHPGIVVGTPESPVKSKSSGGMMPFMAPALLQNEDVIIRIQNEKLGRELQAFLDKGM